MNLFPRSIARIPFLIRTVVFVIVLMILLVPCALFVQPDEAGHATILGIVAGVIMFVIAIAAAVYSIMFLNIPRIRNCGWSPWLVLVLLIPGVGSIFQLVLFFVPPADPNAPDVQ